MDGNNKSAKLSIRRATVSDIEVLAELVSYIDRAHQPHDRRQIRQGSPRRVNGEHLPKGQAYGPALSYTMLAGLFVGISGVTGGEVPQ